MARSRSRCSTSGSREGGRLTISTRDVNRNQGVRRTFRHWLATIAKYHGRTGIPGRSWCSLRQARVSASCVASSASRRSPSIERASRKPGSTRGLRSDSNAASSPATARKRSGSSAGRLNADATPNKTPARGGQVHDKPNRVGAVERTPELPVATVDEVVHRAEDRELLRAVLALPFKDRQAIYLHYFDGLTFAEVGDVLGVREIAARVRVHPALQKLRGRLGPDSVAREVPA